MKKYTLWMAILFSVAIVFNLDAQKRGKRNNSKTTPAVKYDESLYDGVQWRSIGPFRGGRSATVTGVPGKPLLFYFGSTGGGVWKTQDGGNSWENISDGYFGGSIGAVAVSEWDNNVMYVGGGEKTVRGNVSYGYGMWKTVDAGKTWTNIGLNNSRHIGRIRIHPKNPDVAWVGVMGDLYKSSDERGIYKTTDGGKTWNRVLFVNTDAGVVDISLDPNNPRIMFASSWRIRRTPYSLESGGEGSALWKSTDGGDTWSNISKNNGLPKGLWGISAVSVSPVNSERVFTIIENANGGVFRSDDGGKNWTKTNSDRALRQRAWYYTRINADTKDENKVYVMNVSYQVSNDGGRTFQSRRAPHGDHHDLWIAPEDPNRMIIADDGGAQVTYDAGENWSSPDNQPTAQFYRVITDNHFPYRIYGAQQDNSTVRIAHRTNGFAITNDDWESTAGGESAHIAIDPKNNDIVYGGSYGGFLTRVNHSTGESRAINVWPDNPMGHGAEDFKFRFQWNFPIFFSPHDPNKLYAASQNLHVTTNEGQSWSTISPDLTTNDVSKQGSSGGPITKDNTGVEYYCTIFAAIESPYEKDLLWTGSDDGLINVSKDGGKTWTNVTPPTMPKWMMINSIDADPFNKGGVYVAGTRYKMGDYQPYLYKTEDYGATWKQITNGIDKSHFTRVVRADPMKKGLLYAGTETGMYISYDDGNSWSPFQLNLPIVPVTDLTIKDNNLIAATQGRSFWMIDDLTVIHQLSEEIKTSSSYLFKPLETYRMGGGGRFGFSPRGVGQNRPGGVMVYYYVKDTTSKDNITLEFMEPDGTLIRKFSNKAKRGGPDGQIRVKEGSNLFTWNMRYPDAERFDGMILWSGSTGGPSAVPGDYKVKLTVNDNSMEQDFKILKDPRSSSTQGDLQAQFDFVIDVRDKLTETHKAIKNIRAARGQITAMNKKLADIESAKATIDLGKEILKEMKAVEEALYQTKNRSGQDPLNFPIKLNNKLAHLNSLSARGNYKPTDQAVEFKKEVIGMIDTELAKLTEVFEEKVPKYNDLVKAAEISAISIDN